jgi:hypothetical protein
MKESAPWILRQRLMREGVYKRSVNEAMFVSIFRSG